MADASCWAIDGVSIPASLARLLPYMATGGSGGVCDSSAFSVTTLAVPGAAVRVLPGAAIVTSRYPGASFESYAVKDPTETQVSVSPTTSSGGRNDLLVLRVRDSEKEGGVGRAEFVFIQGVSAPTVANANAAHAYVRTLAYPAIPLAAVILPASTGTVTAGMIRDLRRVASPRRERGVITIFPGGQHPAGSHPMPTSVYGSWPIRDTERPTVYVPEWATRINLMCHMNGIIYNGATTSVAGIRFGWGANASENGILMEQSVGRPSYTIAGTFPVTDAQRGTDQLINVQGVRTQGTANWFSDYQSTIAIDYEFVE